MLELHLKPFIARHKIKVWSDAQIQPGQQWKQEIDDALASTRVAVLLVSPEYLASEFITTVELPALLEASKKGEIQILWIAVSPSGYKYTEIVRIQAVVDPKEPLNTLTTAKREKALVKIVDKIREAYGKAEVPPFKYAAYIRRFFDEYLGSPSQPKPFGGRDAEMAALNNWLDDSDASAYRLIIAPGGRGKSALLARWGEELSKRTDLKTIFVPVSMRFGTNLADVVFTSIVSQMASLWDESLPTIGPMDSTSIRATMSTYLDTELPPNRRLLLILDGVDEAADWQVGPNLFPRYPQTGLRVIISARELAGDVDGMSWLQSFGWDRSGLADVMELGPLRRDGVDDVVSKAIASFNPDISLPSVTDEIFRLSEGEPFLVDFYLTELVPEKAGAQPRLRPEELQNLQPGFNEWWAWQNRQWKIQKKSPLSEPRVTAFLSLLSCALGPLSTEDILQLVPKEIGLNTWNLGDVVEPLSRMVLGNGKDHGFVFCHSRLANFFEKEQLTKQERNAYERRFLTWGSSSIQAMQNGELSADEISPYLVRYFGTHLERAGASVAELSELVSDEWRCAWKRLEENHTGFLNDVSRVWDAAEQANLAEINQSRKAPFLHIEVLCALCQASIRSVSTIPDELKLALVKQKLWSPKQVLPLVKDGGNVELREELSPSLTDAERDKLLTDAIAHIEEIEWEWLRVMRFIELARTAPPSYFQTLLNRAWKQIQTIEDGMDKAHLLASIAEDFIDPSPEDIRKEAIDLVFSSDDPNQTLFGLSRLIALLPDEDLERVIPQVKQVLESIEDPYQRLQRAVNLIARLPTEAQTGLMTTALATARTIDDAQQRFSGVAALMPYLRGTDQELVAQDELATAKRVPDLSQQAEDLIILAPYLPESIRTQTINEALSILPREGANIGANELLPALLNLIDLGYRKEIFAVVNAINSETLWTNSWFEVAAHLGEERPVEVTQALETIKDNYLSPARRFIVSPGHSVITRLRPLISEGEYIAFISEALKRQRAIADEKEITEALRAIADYLPQTERTELLQSAYQFGRKITNPKDVIETLPTLPETVREADLKDVYVNAFAVAQQNPDRKERFRISMGLLRQLPEHAQADAVAIIVKQARAFVANDERVKALVSVIPFTEHPLRQELFDEILTLTRGLVDPSWRVQHLVEASLMVSKEDKPGLIEEARASAVQVTYQESGLALAAEMLLGNINRVAAFGFYAEALKIVREINDTFERACMLIVILCHVPEIDREEAESETIATIRAIDDESTRIWLLTWLLRATKSPLKSEIADEIENYALANEWPLLRAAMLINIAAEMEDRRERLLATATGLVLNNHDEPKYEGILSCPYTYVFPIRLYRRLKLAPVFCGMLTGYYRLNNLFGPYPSRQHVIDTLMKLRPDVSDAHQYSFANKLLHAGYQRRYLLDKIRENLPTFVTVGGLNCLRGIARSIEDVGGWWE